MAWAADVCGEAGAELSCTRELTAIGGSLGVLSLGQGPSQRVGAGTDRLPGGEGKGERASNEGRAQETVLLGAGASQLPGQIQEGGR